MNVKKVDLTGAQIDRTWLAWVITHLDTLLPRSDANSAHRAHH